MPKRAALQPVEESGKWRLDVPASLSQSGKRERYTFSTRKLARDYANSIQKGEAAAVSPSTAADVEKAMALLEGTGASLTDAARAYRESYDRAQQSRPLAEAGELWLIAFSGEDVTRKSYERTIGFLEPFHKRLLSSIRADELADLTSQWSRGTYREHYGNARTFWRWCSVAPRQWCQASVDDAVEAPKRRKIKRAVTLRLEEVEKQLRTAEEVDPPMARAYAILLHTGLRKAEAARMTELDLTEDGFRVSDDQAKLDAARFIPLSDVLQKWLKAYPAEVEGEGLLPANFENRDDRIRALCGWSVSSKFLGGNPNPSAPKFPRNAWRKTNASAMIATGHPVQDLVFIFGHSEGIETLRRVYVGAMTKAEGAAILEIAPLKCR
ncbi:MAG: tyrosine-type recombinase/integrase [Luteolibacter sp.]